ncbi:MAG: YgiT-type zinc finger protein [Anaerolineales bacterium]|nr:YgiT-type zinc finger protein [Anaerolineales bacterium]
MTQQLPQPFPCKECQAGIMRPRYITYLTWLDDELITVPNFPAWICDVCGRREYDDYAMSWLSMLLNPNAGHAISPSAPPPSPSSSKQDSLPPATK